MLLLELLILVISFCPRLVFFVKCQKVRRHDGRFYDSTDEDMMSDEKFELFIPVPFASGCFEPPRRSSGRPPTKRRACDPVVRVLCCVLVQQPLRFLPRRILYLPTVGPRIGRKAKLAKTCWTLTRTLILHLADSFHRHPWPRQLCTQGALT